MAHRREAADELIYGIKTASLAPASAKELSAHPGANVRAGSADIKVSNNELAEILGMVGAPKADAPLGEAAGIGSVVLKEEICIAGEAAMSLWKPPTELPPSLDNVQDDERFICPPPNANFTGHPDGGVIGGSAQLKDIDTLKKEALQRAEAARALLADNPSFQEGDGKDGSGLDRSRGNENGAIHRQTDQQVSASKYSSGTDDINAYFAPSFQQQITGYAASDPSSHYAKFSAKASGPRSRSGEEEECKVEMSNQNFFLKQSQRKDPDSEDSEGSSLFGDDDSEDEDGQPQAQSNNMQMEPLEQEYVELEDLFGDDDDTQREQDGARVGFQASQQLQPRQDDSDDGSSLFGSDEDTEEDETILPSSTQMQVQPNGGVRSSSNVRTEQGVGGNRHSANQMIAIFDPPAKPTVFYPPTKTEENESEYESSDEGSVFSLTDRGDDEKEKKNAIKRGGVLGGLLRKISSKGSMRDRDEKSFGKTGYTIKKKKKSLSSSPRTKKRESKKLIQRMKPSALKLQPFEEANVDMELEKELKMVRTAKLSSSLGSETGSGAMTEREVPVKKVSFATGTAQPPPCAPHQASGDSKRVGKSARALAEQPSTFGTAPKKIALEGEDWQNSYREKEWEKTFAMMRRYIKEHENCEIAEGHTLFAWVGQQRRTCRKLIRDVEDNPSEDMTGKHLQRFVHVYRLERIGFDWSTAMSRERVRAALGAGAMRLSPSQRESLGMTKGSPKKGTGHGRRRPPNSKRKGLTNSLQSKASVFDSKSSKRNRLLSTSRSNSGSSDEEFEFKERPKIVSLSDSSGEYATATGSKSRKRQRSAVGVEDGGGFIDDRPNFLSWNEPPERLQKKRRSRHGDVLRGMPDSQWVNLMVALNKRLSSGKIALSEAGKVCSSVEKAGSPITTYCPPSPKGKKNMKTTSSSVSSPLKHESRTPLKAATTKPGNRILKVGQRVYAAWWKGRDRSRAPYFYPGVVASHKIMGAEGRSGSTLLYDVKFDDGDRLCGIDERLVIKRKKYLKRNLKPLLKVGEEVYAAWWDDEKRAAVASWHSGVIVNRKDHQYGSRYGPLRFYDVVFDDGDELDAIQDCFVMKKSEYILSTQKTVVGDGDNIDDGEPKWTGVRNKVDKRSIAEDMWAHDVGWYAVAIDGKEQSFSQLSDALQAYDAYIVRCKGAKTKETDLNLPEQYAFPSPPGACPPVHVGGSDRGGKKKSTSSIKGSRDGPGKVESTSSACDERETQVIEESSKGDASNGSQDARVTAAGSDRHLKVCGKNAKYPAKPSDEFQGWTVREIPRAKGSHVDKYFYSPMMGYQFRSKVKVRRFLECLKNTNGDEASAMNDFHGTRKTSSSQPSESSVPTKVEAKSGSNPDPNQSALLVFAGGTRSTTRAINELIDLSEDSMAAAKNETTSDTMNAPAGGTAKSTTQKQTKLQADKEVEINDSMAATKEEAPDTTIALAESRAKPTTQKQSTPLADKYASYPAMPSDEFPNWTVRKVPRSKGSHVDRYYYSPLLGHRFNSKVSVRRFLECLKNTNGDEASAMNDFQGLAKKSSPKSSEPSQPTKSEAKSGSPSDPNQSMLLAFVSGTRSTTRAIHELISPIKRSTSTETPSDTMNAPAGSTAKSTEQKQTTSRADKEAEINDSMAAAKEETPSDTTIASAESCAKSTKQKQPTPLTGKEAEINDSTAAAKEAPSDTLSASAEGFSKPPNEQQSMPLADKYASYPAEPSDEFPTWTIRKIPRPKGSRVDRYYYSPILGHRFKSKAEVRRFLECLKNTNGDEASALEEFLMPKEKSKDAPQLTRSDSLPPRYKVLEYIPPSESFDNANGKTEEKVTAKTEETNQNASDATGVYEKPRIDTGEKIFARWSGPGGDGGEWFPGRIWDVKELPGGEFGPVRMYDIVFDDGDADSNVDEVWVSKKAEYELCVQKPEGEWIGVRSVRFPKSKDNYARLIGWYVSTIDGKEQTFSLLSAALRAYDAYIVRCKKKATVQSDLNLPDEWVFPTPLGACSPVHV